MTARYNVAVANVTEHLMKKFAKNEPFTLYTFCPYQKKENYSYKTKFWKQFMEWEDANYANKMSKWSKEKLDKLSHD